MSRPVPTPAEAAALDAFAALEGRRWRSLLTEVYWYNARIWIDRDGTSAHGTVLHRLRNRAGGYEIASSYRPRKLGAAR